MISFYKQPSEKFSKGFEPDLPTGVTVSSCTVTAIDNYSGVSDTSVIASTTATLLNDSTAFAVIVQAGIEGRDYKITFLYTCSDGEIREEEMLMQVRSR